MRQLNKIILHCTATPARREVTVKDIRTWHTTKPPYGRGWSDIGYHYVIYQDGSIHQGRPFYKVGAHTLGQNHDSIGVAYVGGVDGRGEPKDTMTKKQEQAFRDLVHMLRTLSPWPLAVKGHNDYSNKACPSFKIKNKFADLIQ